MKNLVLLFLLLVMAFSVSAQDELFVRGDYNGWGTDGGGPLVDDGTNGDAVTGDDIFTYTITIATAGRSEWKIANADWSQIFPWAGGDDNAWIVTTTDNQEVIFTIDKNTYADGFEPTVNIVNANDQLPVPTSDIVAAGDFQGWNNAGTTVMYDDGANGDWVAGDGIYTYYFMQETAGTYSWKPVMSDTWDTWIAAGRTVSSNNLQYITSAAGEDVYFYLDLNSGRVGTSVGEPLPVELSSFTASVAENQVVILWETASELNNLGFDIERKSGENDNWSKIGFIDGKGTTTNITRYSYTDKPGQSGTYFYRLKQIDNDGTYEYSGYVGVEFTSPKNFELSQNYPNPFNPTTIIKMSLPESSEVTLKVYDVTGREVEKLVNSSFEPGVYEIEFNAANLPSGTYFYKLSAKGESQIFNKTGKMLLIK